MKTLICEQPGRLSLAERPDPTRGEGEVLVRIRRVGICGTDFHIFGGSHPFLQYPRVMGHELSGEVVEAPAGSALRAGQPVYVVPYLSCGTCRACRKGLTNCCRRISVLGVHQDGGMAELLAVPQGNVVACDGLGLDAASMVEFLAIGAHGIRRGAVAADDRVLVIGAGPIGLAAMIFARARGAEVTALDTRQDRLAFASSAVGVDGAERVSDGLHARLARLTDGEMFDVVVDATGHAGSMRGALGYVGHGGRLVLLGVVSDELVYADPELHKRETTLLCSRNALPADFADVVAAMAAGQVPVSALNTHRAPLTEAVEHFAAWSRPEAGVIKAILEL